MKQRNQTIDILRLAAAFAVVCLHGFSNSGIAGGEEIVALARFAVPLFFMISGYFAVSFTPARYGRQIVKIFLVAAAAIAFYVGGQLLRISNPFEAGMQLRQWFSPESWKNLLLFNQTMASEHLWFLLALEYCLILDLLLGRFLRKKAVVAALAVCLFSVGLAVYHWGLGRQAAGEAFQLFWYRNFLFMGMPFYLGGRLIRLFGEDLPCPPVPLLVGLIPALLLGSLLEFWWLGVREIYMSSVFLALVLLRLALARPLADGGRVVRGLAWLGRKCSLTVYVLHIAALILLQDRYYSQVFYGQYPPGHTALYYLVPPAAFLLTLGVSVLLALAGVGLKRLFRRSRGAPKAAE